MNDPIFYDVFVACKGDNEKFGSGKPNTDGYKCWSDCKLCIAENEG